jgi:TetR/AcrR family transcriptional regulator, cholesterol catabolism regulator
VSRAGKKKTISVNRENIIRAAERLFIIEGYHGASLENIAREMGVTKAAIYYYIPNKQEILREIINRTIEPAKEVIKVGKSDLPPKKRLRKMITMLIKYGADMQDTTLITFEMKNILPEKNRNTLKYYHKQVEKVVCNTIKEGTEKGQFRVKDIKMASFAVLGAANSIYRWYNPDGGMSPTQIANQFIHLLENGYLKK